MNALKSPDIYCRVSRQLLSLDKYCFTCFDKYANKYLSRGAGVARVALCRGPVWQGCCCASGPVWKGAGVVRAGMVGAGVAEGRSDSLPTCSATNAGVFHLWEGYSIFS